MISFLLYLVGSAILFLTATHRRDLPLTVASLLFVLGGIAGLVL
jgi:hypothetical protein